MIGKRSPFTFFALEFLVLVLFAACGKSDEDKATDAKLTQLLDKRAYPAVLLYFDGKSPEETAPYEVYRAYAHLGLGGLEPMRFIYNIRLPQSFADPTLQRFFEGCPNHYLPKDFRDADRCFTVRLFNQVPDPDNPHLRTAQSLLRELDKQHRLSEQDRVLLAFVEINFVVARVRSTLIQYANIDPKRVDHEVLKSLFDNVYQAGLDMDQFVSTLRIHKDLITAKVTGSKYVDLFLHHSDGKLEFVAETGLPLFLRVSQMGDETTVARIGRNAIIKALGIGTRFFLEGGFTEPLIIAQ